MTMDREKMYILLERLMAAETLKREESMKSMRKERKEKQLFDFSQYTQLDLQLETRRCHGLGHQNQHIALTRRLAQFQALCDLKAAM